jgi:tRNA(Arg) A34 adenosine deaminase TadA
MQSMTDTYLRRCIELAAEAVAAGDDPFGSVLVGADGSVLAEARNRETTASDPTAHPELELAQWAAAHLPVEARAAATVYTSGEHCPMCAAAHAWVGLGPIVYAASSAQLASWRAGWALPAGPVAPLPVPTVAPAIPVTGPVAPYDEQIRRLHERKATA